MSKMLSKGSVEFAKIISRDDAHFLSERFKDMKAIDKFAREMFEMEGMRYVDPKCAKCRHKVVTSKSINVDNSYFESRTELRGMAHCGYSPAGACVEDSVEIKWGKSRFESEIEKFKWDGEIAKFPKLDYSIINPEGAPYAATYDASTYVSPPKSEVSYAVLDEYESIDPGLVWPVEIDKRVKANEAENNSKPKTKSKKVGIW
jgi:hypothetical protein